MPRCSAFEKLGLPEFPVILAPLAGVSDHPFRRVCAGQGASLTYVEMLSAKAILYKSQRTFDMMARHAEESVLGVQVCRAVLSRIDDNHESPLCPVGQAP